MEEKKPDLLPRETEALLARIDGLPAVSRPVGPLPAEADRETETRTAETLRRLLPKVAETMEEMLDSPRVPGTTKLRIMEIILERTLGKAETTVKLNGNPETMEEAMEHIEAIFAAMRVKKGIR